MQEKQPAGLEHSVSLGDVANCDVKSRSRENLAGENCDGKFPRVTGAKIQCRWNLQNYNHAVTRRDGPPIFDRFPHWSHSHGT